MDRMYITPLDLNLWYRKVNKRTSIQMKRTTSAPSSVSSPSAVDRLELAVLFMIKTYLDGGLVERTEVVNMLEDVINRVERGRSEKNLN